MQINTIPELICFVADLFDDEFDYCIDYMPSRYYFLQGGCYELAQVIHHFFPESSYLIRNDGSHVAIMDLDGVIYDATVAIDQKFLQLYQIPACSSYSITDFEQVDTSELDLCYFGGWKQIKVEGKSVHEALIQELYLIDTIMIRGEKTFRK